MMHLFLLLLSFQHLVDTMAIDYRTLIDLDTHRKMNTYRVAFDPSEVDLYIYNIGSGVLFKKNRTETVIIDTLDSYLIDNTEIIYDTSIKKLTFIDAGLGRVFVYDINTKKLQRTDKSYRLRSFYGFKGQLEPNGKIYTYGGSGEFVKKNHILIFHVHGLSEWWEDDTFYNTKNPSVDESIVDFILLKDYYLITYYENILIVRQAVNKGERKREWIIKDKFQFRVSDLVGPSELNRFSNYKLFGSTFNLIGAYFYDLEGNKLQKWVTDKKVYGIFNSSIASDSIHIVYTLSDLVKNPFEFEIITYAKSDFFETNTFETIESQRSRLTRFLLLLLLTLVLIAIIIATVGNRKIKNTHPILISDIGVLVKTKRGQYSFTEKTEVDLFKIINQLLNSDTQKIELEQLDELLFKGLGYKSHITTRRNQLFDKINNELGVSFIKKQKSSSDKRRILVVFDYSTLNDK